jgi:acetylornithine deacetylase/succinyl-diaminopimelate desuccinylase-like protein
MFEELVSKIDNAYTVRRLEEMIGIRSVVGEEAALAEYLRSELNALGFRTEMVEVEPNRPNVYGQMAGEPPGPRLMFNGHTDTVPVCEGWNSDPFKPIVKEGRMYGLGSCDMKAGFACALTALKAFVDSGFRFRGSLMLSGVIDEEAYSKGARAMLKSEYGKCDAIVLCEPYSGDQEKPIPLGITGKALYEVTVKGRAAHGFNPHLGINAIDEAARIIGSLSKLKMMRHPKFGHGNLCTLKIEGGYRTYSVVVPDRCRFEVNRLLVPGESAERAVKDLKTLVSSLDLKAKVEVSTKPPRYEPFILTGNERIISIFHQVYKEVVGADPVYGYASGVTDANVFTGEAGIPCLHLGPRRGGPHKPDEYVSLDWLPLLSKMYTLIAARFLAENDGTRRLSKSQSRHV